MKGEINLKKHYSRLYQESVQGIMADNFQTDSHIDSATDSRLGVTLLLRPDGRTKKKIQVFLDELKETEPEQYYYPETDIHITVLSIISCYAGFSPDQISVPDYISLVEESVKDFPGMEISFRGITASPSCIMIQGFFSDNSLRHIRERLRENFKSSRLQHSVDQRYAISTAHATVVRFRKEVLKKEEILGVMEKYRNHDFGTFTADSLELVVNDWYQRTEKTELLHLFSAPQSTRMC